MISHTKDICIKCSIESIIDSDCSLRPRIFSLTIRKLVEAGMRKNQKFTIIDDMDGGVPGDT